MKTKRVVRPIVFSTFLTLLSIPHVSCQAPPARADDPTQYTGAVDFARTLLAAVMEESRTPGMSVAVGVDGVLVWAEGFGYADLEHRIPVLEDTKFRIGSVSKPLTAAAVGLLVEQGRLDLDAPVQRYVPSFPKKRWDMTTRQLAGHLSGIRHYEGDEFLSSEHYRTVAEGLAIFQDDSLLFQPGERYSYSTFGWTLISAVVEGAAGEDFLTHMHRHVFGPLGMRHTVADHTDSIIPLRTRFYERLENGSVVNAPTVDNSHKWAGGGFLSTPTDLVNFAFAHFGDEFLEPERVAELWTPQRTSDGESTGYGIGWTVQVRGGEVVQVDHGGGSVGGMTALVIRPQERAVIALVGNLTQAPTGGRVNAFILRAFLDSDDFGPSRPGPDLSGRYTCNLMSRGEVALAGAMDLFGPPEAYEGRIAWDNGTVDRIIWARSAPDSTQFVTMDASTALIHASLAPAGADSLAGTWISRGTGPMACARR